MNKKAISKATSQRQLQQDFYRRAGLNIELLRDLFNQMPNVGFYIKDTGGRIIATNRRNLEYSHLTAHDTIIGKRNSDRFTPDQANPFSENDNWVLKNGRPLVNKRFYALSPNRTNRIIVANVFPVKTASDRIIGTTCFYYQQGTLDMNVSNADIAIETAVAEINQRFAERLSLRDLSKSAGLSFATFIRRFTNMMKVPPGRYILNTRINRACALLETTDHLLSDIAIEVGFCDQSHFIKTFKKIRGLTPSAYRRHHRGITD